VSYTNIEIFDSLPGYLDKADPSFDRDVHKYAVMIYKFLNNRNYEVCRKIKKVVDSELIQQDNFSCGLFCLMWLMKKFGVLIFSDVTTFRHYLQFWLESQIKTKYSSSNIKNVLENTSTLTERHKGETEIPKNINNSTSAHSSLPSTITRDIKSNKKYVVIADSFFGSIKCAVKLNMLYYFVLGVRGNVDTEIKNKLKKNLKKNNWRNLYNSKNSLNYCVFHDRAVCSFLSNFRSGEYSVKEIPEIVHFYNNWMNAVDIFNSSLHLNYNTHRNNKWTQAFLYVMLKMALTNSWIFYCAMNNKKNTGTEYLECVLGEAMEKIRLKQKSKFTCYNIVKN